MPVVAGLRSVLSDRKTGKFAAVDTELGNPIDRRKCDHRLGIPRLRIRNESVAALAGNSAWLGNALEKPVVGPVVGVQLPVVAARVIAAVAVEWAVQIVQLRRRRVRYSIDIRADGAPVGVGVDIDCHGGILRNGRNWD